MKVRFFSPTAPNKYSIGHWSIKLRFLHLQHQLYLNETKVEHQFDCIQIILHNSFTNDASGPLFSPLSQISESCLSFISLLISSTTSTPSSTTSVFNVAGYGVREDSDGRYVGLTPKFARVPALAIEMILASVNRPSLGAYTTASA